MEQSVGKALANCVLALGVRIYQQETLSESMVYELAKFTPDLDLEKQAKFYNQITKVIESEATEKQILTSAQDIAETLLK